MLAIVLMDHYLRHRAQNADVSVRHAGHRTQATGRMQSETMSKVVIE